MLELLILGTGDRSARASNVGEVGEEDDLVELGGSAGPVALETGRHVHEEFAELAFVARCLHALILTIRCDTDCTDTAESAESPQESSVRRAASWAGRKLLGGQGPAAGSALDRLPR
jgi:hypothetical protein